MAQELVQTQEQKLVQQQQQRLNAMKVMVVRMLEMPIAQLEQNVEMEMNENPALEGERHQDEEYGGEVYGGGTADDGGGDGGEEQQERHDELEDALKRIDIDDRMATSDYERGERGEADADQEERIYGNMESFYDKLREQVHEQSLTERQEIVMEYLIGLLDADGLLRKDLAQLSDEIAVHEYIDVTEEEIERVLSVLQSFDPAGIGAQSLQQCLLIQIFRKRPTPLTKLMHRVIDECYNDFTKKRWGRIADRLHISELRMEEVLGEIRKLTPRPGAALGETMGKNVEQVTPDFTVECDDEGNLSFTLNRGGLPQLYVSPDMMNIIDAYRQNPQSMTRKDKEALLFAQQKVQRAQTYIEAIRQRQKTMSGTMAVLLKLQREYFLSGDDSDLKPMILKDVADRAGLDISTVSRVCNSKYCDTPWGIIQLKTLFSNGISKENGEEVSTREIKNALKTLVEHEPKGKPLSDIKLAAELKKMGYPIARRTVAKYREQMGIPTSVLRK